MWIVVKLCVMCIVGHVCGVVNEKETRGSKTVGIV